MAASSPISTGRSQVPPMTIETARYGKIRCSFYSLTTANGRSKVTVMLGRTASRPGTRTPSTTLAVSISTRATSSGSGLWSGVNSNSKIPALMGPCAKGGGRA